MNEFATVATYIFAGTALFSLAMFALAAVVVVFRLALGRGKGNITTPNAVIACVVTAGTIIAVLWDLIS